MDIGWFGIIANILLRKQISQFEKLLISYLGRVASGLGGLKLLGR